jgi:putative SOS response-associated peptidase YedK
MCGRFALVTEKHILELLFQLEIREDFQPRFNIAPSQKVMACRLSPLQGNRELASFRWGLVPYWCADESMGSRMINARSETVTEKPSFKYAFNKRRLLIPASGFFEWKKEGGVSQPYYIYRKDEKIFSMAGLWERWEKGKTPLETCTILTTNPNSLVAPYHDRMPVIIDPRHYEVWLDPAAETETLKALLAPAPAEELAVRPVSRLVNSPANDSPELINPL